MPVELAGADGQARDDLVIDGAAPDVEVLAREIESHGIGDLVLYAFEEGDLAGGATGLLIEPVGVRREVRQRSRGLQLKAIARSDIERPGRVAVRGRGRAG